MSPAWSRRTLLQLLAGTALALPTAGAAAGPAFAADAYDTLRTRWKTLMLGSGFDSTAAPYSTKLAALGTSATTFRSSMAPATGSLWSDLPLSTSSSITTSYARLLTMAQAYAQPATGLTGDSTLLADVITGLDHLYTQAYNESTTSYGNWWDWQIGSPQKLLDIATIVNDSLSSAQLADYVAAVDHFVPDSAVATYSGTSTGANRVDLCRVLALRGILARSSAKLVTARDALTPVFPYVTTGDGLYADGSFVQHTYVPYTGSYGAVMIDGLARLLALLSGSTWAVTDSGVQNVFDAVQAAYAPFIYNGLVMDGVAGRAISRGVQISDATATQQDDHLRGHGIISSIALLAESASTAESTTWKGLVKGWIARDYYSAVLTDPKLAVADLYRLQTINSTSSVTATAEPVAHRLFPAMDRAVHRRSGWAASISMASNRMTYYENGNGENLRGWHTGDGMLYWWGSTYADGQYSDAFWPTVDPYRLPGTTVSKLALADGAGGTWGAARPDVKWVGGTTDGEYAAIGQYVKGLSSTLVAKKSWFCVDDSIICLGAGITCTDGTAVETVIDNRNLGPSGTHALTVDGTAQSTTLGWTGAFTSATWAQIGGFGGYVFPGGATVNALREARTGAWSDINTTSATTSLTRRYLTLWFPHGTAPAAATYAYILMPGATTTTTAARAAATSWLTVLANTDTQQGVTVPSLGYTGINFWYAGTVGAVTVSAPASVLIRVTGSTATICVSDPKREATTIDLTWARAVTAVTSKDSTVTVNSTGSSLSLTITPGTAGATHKAVVTLG
ncbi:MAG: hyaluronate lyase [Streptomyces sp.]|nr:hyaluronate lyase [Streptomyces sp.]